MLTFQKTKPLIVNKTNKAQSAIEFFVLLIFLFFVFITFLYIIEDQISKKSQERKDNYIRELALNIKDEFALAFTASDGYTRIFILPNTIDSLEYNITLNGNYVYIVTQDKKHALEIAVHNVTGNILKGQNTIRKHNGSVYLNS